MVGASGALFLLVYFALTIVFLCAGPECVEGDCGVVTMIYPAEGLH